MDRWLVGCPVGRSGRRGGRRGPAAFTLIELLVVIAVIGILSALLMPTVISSMKSAQTANCKSNLRQTSAAFLIYAKDHSGFMCPSGSPSKAPPNRFPHWDKNLEPYTRDLWVFQCPSKKRAEVGYGLNHMWCGPDQIYGGVAMWCRSREIGEVRNPSATVILCDMGILKGSETDIPIDDWEEKDGPNNGGCVRFPYDNRVGETGKYTLWHTSPRRPFPRHAGGRTSALFIDGHVNTLPTTDIVDHLWDEPGCLYDNDGHPKRK